MTDQQSPIEKLVVLEAKNVELLAKIDKRMGSIYRRVDIIAGILVLVFLCSLLTIGASFLGILR